MNIRTVALPKDTDLRAYLIEAEESIDALSDEELDAIENELEVSIRNLVNPKPVLRLIGVESRKVKIPHQAYPVLSGLLVAALALLFLHTKQQDETPNVWTTKGQIGDAGICSLLIQQVEIGSAEFTDTGYRVKSSAPVYAKTSCLYELKLEAFEKGAWLVKETAESKGGYLAKDGKLIDLRRYLGKDLRIRSREGLSEEFVIRTDR